MTDQVWIDGPMHPDLFDDETPVRLQADTKDLNLKVFRVECTYYEPDKETHYIVAESEGDAVEQAWQKINCEETPMDEADAEELDLDTELNHWSFGRITTDTKKTARDLLVEHIEKHGCTLTQS